MICRKCGIETNFFIYGLSGDKTTLCEYCWKSQKIRVELEKGIDDENINCPYCGKMTKPKENYISWDDEIIICSECNNQFILNTDVEITYYTKRIISEEQVKEEYEKQKILRQIEKEKLEKLEAFKKELGL